MVCHTAWSNTDYKNTNCFNSHHSIIVSTGIISPVLLFLHILGVALGFEQISYTVTEGTDANVELCAIIFNGSLERAATVVFSTSDGNATSSG